MNTWHYNDIHFFSEIVDVKILLQNVGLPEQGQKSLTAHAKTSKWLKNSTEKCYFEYEFIALSGNPNIGTVINYVSIVTHNYDS